MIRILTLLVLAISTSTVAAQFGDEPSTKKRAKTFADYGKVQAEIVPQVAKPGEKVTLRLSVIPKPGATTYPTVVPQGQSSKNLIPLPPPGDLIFVGPVTDPKGEKLKPRDKAHPDGPKDLYYPGPATWELTAFVSPDAKPGKKSIALPRTKIYICDEDNCLPSDPGAIPTPTLEVAAGPSVAIPPEYESAVRAALTSEPKVSSGQVAPPSAAPQETPTTAAAKRLHTAIDSYEASLNKLQSDITAAPTVQRKGLLGFLGVAALWGLISLVTPCVFPMIPITVSIFLKQSHDSTAQTLKLAGVYCLTIIVVLGISAFALLKIFVDLSRDPIMNVMLGGLFVVFALSLFGMYDLTLPQGMLRFTQKRQGAGGVLGTVFGAIAFTIIGFTCVAPFLGGFAGLAASGNYSTFELILGSLAFATAFASPFFLLALFPRLLKTLPRSGGWLDSVKAVMGFLELAAAFKFFRTAELAWLSPPEYFTYDLVLGAWVAIAAAAGLYLLGVFRLPHDEEKPNIGVLRMMFALGFLSLAVYLFPATFKTSNGQSQRPSGTIYAWVDAFLLPDSVDESSLDLPFGTDLQAALEQARKEKQQTGKPSLVFIDFTGELCNNCKLNEKNVFPLPMVKDQLKKYQRVKLFTDWVPEHYFTNPPSRAALEAEGEANGRFQFEVFGTRQLPYYVILEPLLTGGVKVVGVYDEGKINDPARFAAFLREAQEKAATP